jgi:hypothetical protein
VFRADNRVVLTYVPNESGEPGEDEESGEDEEAA